MKAQKPEEKTGEPILAPVSVEHTLSYLKDDGLPSENSSPPKKLKKETAPKKDLPPGLAAMLEGGIPIKVAKFTQTVSSYKGEPETAFFAPGESAKPSRTANMWYTPHGLVCEQDGVFTIIGTGAIVYARVL